MIIAMQDPFMLSRDTLNPLFQRLRCRNSRYAHPPALLAGTDGNLLPVRDTLFDAVRGNAEVNALAVQRCDGTHAQLGCFLNRPIESVAFTQTQAQRGVDQRLRLGCGG